MKLEDVSIATDAPITTQKNQHNKEDNTHPKPSIAECHNGMVKMPKDLKICL